MAMQQGDDFPQLCETCLGPNPYVRMVKLKFGEKLCKISNLPYQGFRWKAGAGGRMKETIVSIAVARERDICQTCLNDMKYGLPVGLRDKLLAQQESQALALPTSDVGLRYHYQQLGSAAEGDDSERGDGSHYGPSSSNQLVPFALEVANQQAARQLDVFARAKANLEARNKTAFRNLPKLCSFWVAGSCTRVVKKVCQFRPCCGSFVFPEIASNRELHESLAADLEAHGPEAVMRTLDNDTRVAIKTATSGVNRDEAIRKRVTGEDDLAQKYLNQFRAKNPELAPPADGTITTLWVGGLEEWHSEAELRDALYAFHPPELPTMAPLIHVLRQAHCAFLEYPTRALAEAVAAAVTRSIVVAGKSCPFDWAKPKVAPPTAGLSSKVGKQGVKSRSAAQQPPPPPPKDSGDRPAQGNGEDESGSERPRKTARVGP